MMKKMMITMMALLTIAAKTTAMSYEQARNEALFLTDKMAYELNLTDAQYEAAYEINLDYLMGVATYDDVYGPYWEQRNLDLSYILHKWQWDAFRAATYFYRPLYWSSGYWHFGIYARYPHRDYFFFGRPVFYATYRGGHSWRSNHGRSYYHAHIDHFRPAHHNNHFGMRDGWDRGDFRNNHVRGGRNSSTRTTVTRPGGTFGRSTGSLGRNNGGSFGRNDGNNRNSNGGSFGRNDGNLNSGSSNVDNNRLTRPRIIPRSTDNNSSNSTINRSMNSGSHNFGGSRSTISSGSNSSFGGSRSTNSGSNSSFSGGRSTNSGSNSSFGGGRSTTNSGSGRSFGGHR